MTHLQSYSTLLAALKHFVCKRQLSLLAIIFLMFVVSLVSPPNATVIPSQQTTLSNLALTEITQTNPDQNKGVRILQTLASIGLKSEFSSHAAIADKFLRAREIELAPGGKMAVHQDQPGITYILEGEVWAYSNNDTIPNRYTAGAIASGKKGVELWWHNQSEHTVKVLMIDIAPAQG